MSDTHRHIDFYWMRQASARLRQLDASVDCSVWSGREAPGSEDLTREFNRLWRVYGHKSMVMDKRRRASTRQTNSRFVREMRRAQRHQASRLWHRAVAEEMG